MGCFNKTGFLSHLPIQYGDEIVLFVCADESKIYHKSSCPISLVGGGLTPICPPMFGKYNDYGGIEDVVDDPNHKYFTEIVGMSIDKFADIIHDLSGYTIKDFREGIKKYEENPDEENNCHYETKEDFQKMLDLYTKLFKEKEWDIPKSINDSEETTKKINEFINRIREFETKRIENMSIVVTMEHKSVYDKMVEVGRTNYSKKFLLSEKVITPEEAFDNSVDLYRKISNSEEKLDAFNPLKEGVDALSMSNDSYRNFFGVKVCLHDTVTNDNIDYAIYNTMNCDFADFKDVFVDYAYFLSSMHSMNVMFETSPYHSQTISYETLIPVFEEILNTLLKSAEK